MRNTDNGPWYLRLNNKMLLIFHNLFTYTNLYDFLYWFIQVDSTLLSTTTATTVEFDKMCSFWKQQ